MIGLKSTLLLTSLFWIGLGAIIANHSTQSSENNAMNKLNDQLTYLALGDSYTIGEGVKSDETYPAQLVKLLAAKNINFSSPEIIATTGWTTDELQQGIDAADIDNETYSLVTLLIGVNNQYRGRSVENFKTEFNALLDRAIAFAGGDKSHVIVISIPDWGVTRFAELQEVDKEKVALEIDAYNQVKRQITERRGISFLDITQEYRQIGHAGENLVSDGLHPSGRVYHSWAEKLVGLVIER